MQTMAIQTSTKQLKNDKINSKVTKDSFDIRIKTYLIFLVAQQKFFEGNTGPTIQT